MSIKTSDAAKIFKSLADQNRLAIALSLIDGEKNAKELLVGMDFLQPTLSHHLSLMCESGLLTSRRDGKNVYYAINAKAINDIAEIIGSLASASQSAAKKSTAPKTVKRSPVREKAPINDEPKEEPPKPEEPQVRRSQVFDFFD